MCVVFVCMYVFFSYIHTCNVITSARGSWSSAPEAAGISNRVAGIEMMMLMYIYMCVGFVYMYVFMSDA